MPNYHPHNPRLTGNMAANWSFWARIEARTISELLAEGMAILVTISSQLGCARLPEGFLHLP